MAHNWKPVDTWRRQCSNCGKTQYRKRQRDTFGRLSYTWRPRAPRCTVNNMGRPPLRRDAILAAIKDGRHTPTGIAAHAGLSIPVTRTALSEAKRPSEDRPQGYVVNPRRGWWELAPEHHQ